MWTLLGTMDVKLLLEKRINGGIERKWESRRPRNTETTIKIEAKGAIQEQIDLGTAHLEWFIARWIEKVFGSAGIVVVGHDSSLQ